VAVDDAGDAHVTVDPRDAAPSWAARAIDPHEELSAVSCSAAQLCVAVDARGDAFVSGEPATGAWSSLAIDSGTALNGVSCVGSSLCVAVDAAGNALTGVNPASSTWPRASIDPGHALQGVSCATVSLCVAVDDAGDVLASRDPTSGSASWHRTKIAFDALTAVSCAPPASACVAVDAQGDVLASANPGAPAATWSLTPVDPGERPAAVSCAQSGLCVALDGSGRALASDNPASTQPTWSVAQPDVAALVGITCLPGGLCEAVDAAGRALAARVPAASAVTSAPSEVTATGATLTGLVDPNDAVLGACSFEYGTGVPYTASTPCSLLPAANGGLQGVSATTSGLAPNTTYHYRLIASSPAGGGAGADATFTTALSSQIAIVHPHPSIVGTPAVKQTLSCHTGIQAEASVRLAYAWLRDGIPIAGSAQSTYKVKGQDAGHHLQCQVTATDGGGSASAKSAFVTIPAPGVPASVGETALGRATYSHRRIHIPVSCSPQARAGCRVALRLTATVRRHSATIASAAYRLRAGTRRTLSAPLNASGRRLLKSKRGFAARLQVRGTVIGVIEGQLASRVVRVGSLARRASAASSERVGASPELAATAHASGAAPLAATPYMGWDTYFALGGRYSEATILQQASELISLGLRARGYRYVWLDVGWWQGTRDASGQITTSAKQWPHGLPWLTRTLHAAGLRVGLYTDAGPNGCGGAGQGSYGHYAQDANTFAAWGIDAVKVDFCGGAEYGLNPASAYGAFHAAILANTSHRPMLLSICNFLEPEQYGEGRPSPQESVFASYAFGPGVGNSWRTDTDVGTPGHVSFAQVLRNMDADAAAPQAAGPGHWNDPDYLGPDQGMNATQFHSQLSMWALLAAPLMISTDLAHISRASLHAVQNSEVIAIDQDPGGVQGTLVSSEGSAQVWVKPLVDGSRAVALLNRSSHAVTIATSASAVGLPAAGSYALRNTWTHRSSVSHGAIRASVPADGTVLLRVSTG
jgi:hypothetical protein